METGGLLTQVNYREKCAFAGLKEWSLNTGDLKVRDRLYNIINIIPIILYQSYTVLKHRPILGERLI